MRYFLEGTWLENRHSLRALSAGVVRMQSVDEIDDIRSIALSRGLGSPYLCDGTCDTCYCLEWESGDYCEVGQCPVSECDCDECWPHGDDDV